MEAEITKDGEITVVKLRGYLNFETFEPFRKTVFQKLINQNVIFDLRGLNFVGSSGITGFFDVLKSFKDQNTRPTKFCGFGQEFRRIVWTTDFGSLELYEDALSAYASFYQPVQQIPKPQWTMLDPDVIIEDSATEEDL